MIFELSGVLRGSVVRCLTRNQENPYSSCTGSSKLLYTSEHMSEIMMKAAYNTNQSINQSINQSFNKSMILSINVSTGICFTYVCRRKCVYKPPRYEEYAFRYLWPKACGWFAVIFHRIKACCVTWNRY